jgi:hypothetical protein
MLQECLIRGPAGVALTATLLYACGIRQPQQPARSANQPVAETKIENSCSLLSETEIADVVGNSVEKGQVEGNSDVCKWRTEDPRNVDVLLIFRDKGSTREQVLCDDVRSSSVEHLPGLGDAAIWKFSRSGLFNSGDLEVCGPKGYLNITLQGQRDETTLKAAAVNLTQKILQRL